MRTKLMNESAPSFRDRTSLLLGPEGAAALSSSRVLVAGLGGVGGTCFEALVRAGVESFLVIDADKVEPSNLNRQLLFDTEDLGKKKIDAAYERAALINPDVNVDGLFMKVDASFDGLLLDGVDVVIDCIDDVRGKLGLIRAAKERNIPVLSSLGMGFRLNPTKVRLSPIEFVTGDPLGRALKGRAKKSGVSLSGVLFAHSEELPAMKGETIASMMMVPSAAGLALAYGAISILLKKKLSKQKRQPLAIG